MRFDRQVLYLVFLFGTTHALPARNTTLPTTTASLDDDSPSLTLDISPQLISSVADFATQVVAAVFSPESGSSSSSRTSTRNLLDDESSGSSDPTPPGISSLRRTRIAAAPSDSKSPAVISSTSTSTPGRSKTGLSSRLSIARTSLSPRPAAQTTSTHARLQHSSLTAEDQDTPLHHATPTHPANAHAAGAQKNTNSTVSNNPMSQGSGAANTMAATTTAPFGGILDIIGQAASSTDSRQDEEPSATNALDVLFSALPSSYATSIQSQFSDLLDPIASDINSFTSDLFAGERTTGTRTGTRPTTRTDMPPTTRQTTTRERPHTTRPTTRPTTEPTSTPTSLPPPSQSSETTTQPPTTTLSTGAATTTPAPPAATTPSASNPISNASTIGIATGVASGVVLLCLGGLYLYRRRAAGLAPFNKRSGSKRSNKVYPEVAWLYDPDITPPRSRAGSSAGDGEAEAERLVPAPRPGSVEMAGTAVGGGYDRSPEMRGQGSPLLAPVAARGGRGDLVGSRSRSGSEVDVERLRPLSIVREESPGRSFTRG